MVMTATPPLDPYGLIPDVEAGRLKVMRSTLLGSADVCGPRAQHGLRYQRPETQTLREGTAYHAGLSTYYHWRRNTGEVVPSNECLGVLRDVALSELLHKGVRWREGWAYAAKRVGRLLGRYFDPEKPCYWDEDHTILAVEAPFYYPFVDGWVAHGTWDLVVGHKLGRIAIDDHKSAKRPWPRGKEGPRAKAQAPWYAYWWAVLTGAGPEYPAAFFSVMADTDPKATTDRAQPRFKRIPVDLTEASIEATIDKARRLCELLDVVEPAGMWLHPNTDSKLCSQQWCDWWERCPYGARMGA